ncbi:MAG: helix-turn-helix domain-containing protein [Klebsiella sp.]|nr:helix-turn-helix domain-containing protein [Klebsiella sp.]
MHDVSASKLRQLLFEMGWNKSELARKLEVSAQTVHQWEKGITRPSGKNLTKLSEVSGKPEHWFFQESDDKQSEVTDAEIPLTGDDLSFLPLSDEERRLLTVYRKFPSIEANNMLLAFEIRYKKLLEFYSEYADPSKRKG